tara:strand:+ start:212 stop:916 length:705 start_codon:yes stop_codon:yes gene_type:complete
MNPHILGFDADDTLWENEARFSDAEKHFCELMSPWADQAFANKALLEANRTAVPQYGYGIKSFVLAMIRTAIDLSKEKITASTITEIMTIGDTILNSPVELLPKVKETLETLAVGYRLLVITKGDIKDQLAKVDQSGLANYFWEIEVVSEKNEDSYRSILNRYEIPPSSFTMIGNSIVSDVLPVLAIGGRAVHIPHHTTWELEIPNPESLSDVNFPVLQNISEIPELLYNWPAN